MRVAAIFGLLLLGSPVRADQYRPEEVPLWPNGAPGSGAKSIDARSVQMDRSGVVNLASEHVVLHDGSAVVVTTKEARLVKSRVLLLVADDAHLDGESRVLIRIGRGKAGPGAAIAGAAGASALLAAFVLLLGRLILGRRRD